MQSGPDDFEVEMVDNLWQTSISLMNNSGGVSENRFEFCMVTGVLLTGSNVV